MHEPGRPGLLTLPARDVKDLRAVLARSVRSLPAGRALFAGTERIGYVVETLCDAVCAALPGARLEPGALRWPDPPPDAARRGAALQAAAERLRDLALVRGWRGEPYAVLDADGREWARFERAAFRTFGCRSRAAHVHGELPDGRIWVGRRASTKATDPGRLDNLAAGGISAGEDAPTCAWRELFEEAGVAPDLARRARALGMLRTCRAEPEGLHDEDLLAFGLALPAGFVPHNRDGEVAEFLCLEPPQVVARIRAGEFTEDAAAVTALALLRQTGA